MFTKKNLRKEIDAKLDAKTPHLETYEKALAPMMKTKKGLLAPMLSLCLGVAFLFGGSFLIVRLSQNPGTEQNDGELSSSKIQETGTGQSNPSASAYDEADGYFSLSLLEASKKGLALDAALTNGKQNEKQVHLSFFLGFQGIDGTSLYEGNNSAFSGKKLGEITNSAILNCEEGLAFSETYSNVFGDAHFQIELLEMNHGGSWGYRHYHQESLMAFDCSSLDDGNGVLRFAFGLDQVSETYSAETSVHYQKQGGFVSLAKLPF